LGKNWEIAKKEVENMGRRRRLKKTEWLTITKTDGFTVLDTDKAIALQLASVMEDRWRRDSTNYFSYNISKNIADNLTWLKKKGLIQYDHKYYDRKRKLYHFAGIRLTDKGIKTLSVAGGRVFLHPKR
jgi:hypothetical protein